MNGLKSVPRAVNKERAIVSSRMTKAAGILLMLAASPFAVAADSAAVRRPKIGIALEGGGALGLGHIGVLEWLEANHIPVDYIAGTSMGGLVGGLYATGKSTAEIRTLIRNVNWDDVLRGQIPYQDLSYRRKEDARAYPNYIELGLKSGLEVPGGLNSGQQVKYILDRAALPYAGIKNFDELPVPFRCVATDMKAGTSHVFKDGSLPDALRATMSLPGIFMPAVTPDGKIYADGGLLNNLPVDVVKAMGADIVIAVYLATSPFDPKESPSMFTMLGQSLSVMIAANERRNIEMADILITVNLAGYTSLDYGSGDKIADLGVQGAEKKRRMLLTLAVDEPTWARYREEKQQRRIVTVPQPQFVAVEGADPKMTRDLETSLQPFVGKELEPTQLERSLTRILGMGRFSTLSYQIVEQNGRDGLVVAAQEKSYAPPVVKPGVFLASSGLSNLQFGLGARITYQDVGGFRSEWRSDILIGTTYSVASEFYRPFTVESRWFIAPHINASTGPVDFYHRSQKVAEYQISQTGGGVDIGYLFNRNSELRVGYTVGYKSVSLNTGAPDLPTVSGRYGNASLSYTFDGLDSPLIPRSGKYLSTQIQYFDTAPGNTSAFPVAQMNGLLFKPISKPGSIFLGAYGGSTFGDKTALPQFLLGGALRLGAYGFNEILTDQFFLLRTGYIHQIGKLNPLIGDKIYAIAFLEGAKIYGNPQVNSAMDANAGVVVTTFLGPVLVGGAWGESGHRKIYFTLGRIF
jgi:NTE family protein